MKTLADPAVCDALRERLQRLTPQAVAMWGRMNAPQMIAHLNDSFRLAAGELNAAPATNLLQRTLVKWVALRLPVRWPQGVPTRPEVEQGKGGTPPASWDADCTDLVQFIDGFAARQTFNVHPIFGKLSKRDWLRWGFRHVDHHFRQFGA